MKIRIKKIILERILILMGILCWILVTPGKTKLRSYFDQSIQMHGRLQVSDAKGK